MARSGIGQRSRQGARAIVFGSVALILVLAAAGWRIDTERSPPIVLHRTLAADVRLPGAPPTLSWPREGEAAVEVQGVGSFGHTGPDRPVPIASVAKIMTAYLTLRQYPLSARAGGFAMTVTAADAAEREQRVDLGESTVAVRAGERLDERQALQALLLPSANNIAAMLAVHDAGSTAAFVARMNATARELGMDATTYTDPSGFEASTVSSAADQLKLAAAAMREPVFAAIVDQSSARLPVVGVVANYNALVGEDGYVGVKTGSDLAAGGCLVFAKRVRVGGRTASVLGVVLGQRDGAPIEAALASARQLGDSVAAALGMRVVLPAGTSVLSVSSTGGQAMVVTREALREIGWSGLTLPVQVRIEATSRATHAQAGQPLASVKVEGAGTPTTPTATPTTTAVAARSLGEPSLGWRLEHLL
jgi:D-alanyl-D-alanine carboxypeptidase (penicillin-binding protein 5/6)